jgi:hypothetical protein
MAKVTQERIEAVLAPFRMAEYQFTHQVDAALALIRDLAQMVPCERCIDGQGGWMTEDGWKDCPDCSGTGKAFPEVK